MTTDERAPNHHHRWGLVGANDWGPLRRCREDGEGVTRVIGSAEVYLLEAETGLPFPKWVRIQDGQHFEMDLGDDDPPRTTSLADLRGRLVARHRHLGSEPELDQLDRGLSDLLGAIAELHRRGFAAGLLRPDNILFRLDATGAYAGLILPDVGFALLRGVLPEWLRPDSPDAPLWDVPTERVNERCFDRDRHPSLVRLFAETSDAGRGQGFDSQADLRTVTRLIAWVLGPSENRPRKVPPHDPAAGRVARVWLVLGRVMSGEIASAEAFRNALAVDPASQDFIERNVVAGAAGPPFWRRALVPILAASALLGLGYLGWKMIPGPPVGPPECPSCTEQSPLFPLLIELEAARKQLSLPVEVEIVGRMHAPGLFGPSGPREVERICQETIRKIILSDLGKAGEALLDPDRYGADGLGDPKITAEANRLRDQFARLHEWGSGRKPQPEDFPPWLKKLDNLGYISSR